jgi:hypothetical protein
VAKDVVTFLAKFYDRRHRPVTSATVPESDDVIALAKDTPHIVGLEARRLAVLIGAGDGQGAGASHQRPEGIVTRNP